jgi:bifunctional N-acetylglucosamine-1-phosphate-uridyltransferase/glucosamine-1-phosphate-acetyltransferase GlmU-like protein
MVAIAYMAAGKASRFGGDIKALAQITESQKLIDLSLQQALPAGFTEIILIVSHETKPALEKYLTNEYQGIPVSYIIQETPTQRVKPLGTGHATAQLANITNKPCVIVNSDDLYGEHPIKTLHDAAKQNKNATIGYKLRNVLPKEGAVNRGIFAVDQGGSVRQIIETTGITRNNLQEKNITLNSLASMNLFALTSDTLSKLKTIADNFETSIEGNQTLECGLPMELCKLIEEKKISLKLFETHESCTGVTRKEDVPEVQKYLLVN